MGNNGSQTIGKEETCVICQERVMDNVSRPDCCPNHFFHHKCLMEWAKHKNTCPLDNKEFKAVIDRKGKRFEVEKPVDESIERLSTLFTQMLALHHLVQRSRFACSLCDTEQSELERSEPDTCDHRFHRQCLTRLARVTNSCPVDDCNIEFSKIHCEFGETLQVSELRHPSTCHLCKKEVGDDETATPNSCDHRFHRQCLYNHAKNIHECPTCESQIYYLKCENGNRIVIQNFSQIFKCGLCHSEDREKETAKISNCGHVFHRECLLRRFRDSSNCPLESCAAPIDTINCQFGDVIQKTVNPLSRLIANLTCDNDFVCVICDTKREELERAKLSCGCEFHRRCIVQVARIQDELKCPKCRAEYSTIQCLFGESLTVQKRNKSSSHSLSESESAGSRLREEGASAEEPIRRQSSQDVSEEEQGATGGSDTDLLQCNLCETVIPKTEGYRPKNCQHWYHKLCVINLSKEIGCCLSCQGEVSVILDEDGDTIPMERVSPEFQDRNVPVDSSNQCYTCGSPVPDDELVRPNNCYCLFHRKCLTSIKEIMSFCPICNSQLTSIIDCLITN